MVIAISALATPAAAAAGNDGLLDRASRQAERMLQDIAAVTCFEAVTQLKLSPEERILARREAAFDYLLLLDVAGGEIAVTESREVRGEAPRESDRALLTTTGFAALFLVFHPAFRDSFRFSETGVAENGQVRIRFEAIPGSRTPSVLQLKGRHYPIEWRGEAWLRPDSGQPERIVAEIGTAIEGAGLQTLRSEVHYALVPFPRSAESYWLPTDATVDAGTARQHWRNLHRFSAYRQFGVSVDQKLETPK